MIESSEMTEEEKRDEILRRSQQRELERVEYLRRKQLEKQTKMRRELRRQAYQQDTSSNHISRTDIGGNLDNKTGLTSV